MSSKPNTRDEIKRKSKRDYNKKNRFRTPTPSNCVGEDSLKYESFHYNTVFNPSKPHFMLLLQQGECTDTKMYYALSPVHTITDT